MQTSYIIIIAAIGGLVLGYVVAWLVGRSRAASLETELKITKESAENNLKMFDNAKESLSDAFKALSSDALKSSSTQFLELAKLELGKLQSEARGDLDKRLSLIHI